MYKYLITFILLEYLLPRRSIGRNQQSFSCNSRLGIGRHEDDVEVGIRRTPVATRVQSNRIQDCADDARAAAEHDAPLDALVDEPHAAQRALRRPTQRRRDQDATLEQQEHHCHQDARGDSWRRGIPTSGAADQRRGHIVVAVTARRASAATGEDRKALAEIHALRVGAALVSVAHAAGPTRAEGSGTSVDC